MEQLALQVWEQIQFWRFEILVAVALLGAEIIRRKYKNNAKLLAFIDFLEAQMALALADKMKAPLSDTPGGKRKLRRKIRRQLQKEARKANRGTGKGSKTSSK